MSELGRLIKLEYGVALLAEFRTGHGFPVFGSNGEVGRHSKCLVEGPGIIVGRKGSVGKVSWSSESFWPIDTTYFVSATKEKLKWLYWILYWLPLERLDTSTGVPGLNRNDVYSLSVFEPSDDEKRMVANILDTLDTTIRQTEAIIAKLQQVKQGLLHDLLTRGIDANGQLRPPVEQAPHLYKESPLGWIPREWEVGALSDVADVARGKFTHRPRNDPAFYGGSYPFIQTGDVAAALGGIVTTYSQTLSTRGTKVSQEFPAGTIAITIAANIADTAILGNPMYFPDSVVGAVVGQNANCRFIELCIRSAKHRLESRAPQSAQKNINLQDLRPLQIPILDIEEQNRIAGCYESIQTRIEKEKSSLTKYKNKKSALMDDLLTGRVRVTALLAQVDASS